MAERDTPEQEPDPSEGASGDEPATDEQRADIDRLSGEGETFGRELNQAEAAQLIDELSHRTG